MAESIYDIAILGSGPAGYTAAIRAGQYDCALVFGVEKMPKGIIRSSFFEPWREEAGLAATPAYFALRAQRLMLESDVTLEDLARGIFQSVLDDGATGSRRPEPRQRGDDPVGLSSVEHRPRAAGVLLQIHADVRCKEQAVRAPASRERPTDPRARAFTLNRGL